MQAASCKFFAQVRKKYAHKAASCNLLAQETCASKFRKYAHKLQKIALATCNLKVKLAQASEVCTGP